MTPRRQGRCEKIALIGARGVGKSTIGTVLADRLRWAFADADAELATQVGQAAGEFLALRGEAAFRAVEQEVTCRLLRSSGRAVLALGGGAVTIPAVDRALRRPTVVVVWLHAPPEVLVERIESDSALRPPLTALPLDEEVRALLARRRAACEELAHVRLETFPANVDACCTELLATIKPLLTEL